MDVKPDISNTCNPPSTNQPKLCRLCLAFTTTTFSLVENTEFSSMLEALTSLKILPTDTISTVMCLKCRLNLKLAFKIQQAMLTAERRFRDLASVNPIKQEKIEIEEKKYQTDMSHVVQTIQVQDGPEDYTCNICGKRWLSRSDLSRHKKNVHEQVDCQVCGKRIKKGNIKAHMDNKHASTGEVHACAICGIEKSSKVALYKHQHWVHKLRKCPICDKEFTSTSLKKHLAGHSPPRELTDIVKAEMKDPAGANPPRVRHICDLCGVEKSSKATLTRHRHSVHKLSKCSICDKVVKRESLRKHLKIHNTSFIKVESVETEGGVVTELKGAFVCDLCGKHKTSEAALKQHKYNVHIDAECPVCKKKMSKANLKPHMERHRKILAVCELCGVSVVKQDLRRHMMNVHVVRKLKCGFCDKIFKKHYTRTLHERREHLGEANFSCDTCGKKFYSLRRLRRHVDSTHLKLRPHVCELCNIGFSSKFTLRDHRRQHTNERPFKCVVCGDGFRQKVTLKYHLKAKHDISEELTCECDICGKKFGSALALRTHRRVH